MIEATNGVSSNNLLVKEGLLSLGPRDFILKYLKYLPWILICVAISLVIAFLRIRYTDPIFDMQASFLIKSDRGGNPQSDTRFNEMFMGQQSVNMEDEMQILKSTPVMERVVRDLNLQTQYFSKGSIRSTLLYPISPIEMKIIELADSSSGFSFLIKIVNDNQFIIEPNGKPLQFGQIFSINGNTCILNRDKTNDLHDYPPDRRFILSWQPAISVASGILSGLTLKQDNDQSNILFLSHSGASKNLSKDVLNMLMMVYDTLVVEEKNRTLNNTFDFIQNSLDTLEVQLNGSENSLKGYMVKNNVFDIQSQAKNYFDLSAEAAKSMDAVEVKLKLIELLTNYINNEENRYKMVPLSLGIEEPVLLKLVTEYNSLQTEREAHLKTTKEANPLITNSDVALSKTRHDILEVLQKEKEASTLILSSMVKKDKETSGKIQSMPGKSMGLINIQRRQKILEELYTFLLQKKFESSMSSAATVSNSKVVEPAKGSSNPVKPDKKSIYTLSVLFGIMIPLAIIIVLELLRDKVSGRGDIEKYTNAPILGEIGHSSEPTNLVVKKNSRRFIAEQFRIVRSNLQYIIAKKENPVIMVTSSFSGEGKSFISTNMGAVMALAGKKTVIMEFDIRKPKIATGLDLKRKMGITNYIIGNVKFEDLLLQVEGFDNLFVIPCGPIPPNPAELLLDKKLQDLVDEVKKDFDVVIMDTAPVGLVSDAINLSHFADCTLYIVRQDHTFRKHLRLIEELYTEQKLPGISIIVNDVGASGGYYGGYYGGYGNGYGYGYGYGYGAGYFEDDANRKKGLMIFRKARRWLKKI